MPRRRLGRAGIEVGVLGLGTVKFGRDQGVKYPRGFTIPDDRAVRALLDLARDLGINLLDTAPAYGDSEERLGRLLRGTRDHWVICTKVGEEFEAGVSRHDFSPGHVRASVERSLRRLQTGVLDIVLIHSDGNDELIIEQSGALETLAELKREGKLRSFGMSTKTVAGGLRAAARCDPLMVSWNLADETEVPVIDRCRELGTGVLIKKALASGHVLAAGDASVRATFARILAHSGVGSLVIGTIDPDHLRANVRAAVAASCDSGR
ncbi:MAG: aldo/keto reductase [Porticoccaceae bacterium]|nr:MAG: aldo/keto reductase [Porticoccaceae bacterium]